MSCIPRTRAETVGRLFHEIKEFLGVKKKVEKTKKISALAIELEKKVESVLSPFSFALFTPLFFTSISFQLTGHRRRRGHVVVRNHYG